MDYWGISPWLLLFAAPFMFCALIWAAIRVVLALGPLFFRHLHEDEHPGRLRWTPGRWWGLPGFAGPGNPRGYPVSPYDARPMVRGDHNPETNRARGAEGIKKV